MGSGIDGAQEMQIHRLSAAKVRNAKPGLHADGGGLYLQVTCGKDRVSRSWLFRYSLPEIIISASGKLHRRTRDAGLGPTATVSLSEAREKARQLRQQRLDGIDPIEHRKAQRLAAALDVAKSMSFDECRDAYFQHHRGKWRAVKHAALWRNSLETYVTPVLGRLPVKDIDLGLIIRTLEPIWTAKPETASRIRGRVEAILDWAAVSGFRSTDNPARWALLSKRFASRTQLAPVKHFAALPYAEIGAFMARLRTLDGTAARALEFAILTCGRSNEVLGARWDEIDLSARTWTVPATRMKSRREHRVPLSDTALNVLEQQRAVLQSEYIFPGAQRATLNPSTLNRLVVERLGRTGLTIHGFRSSFRDWAAERTSFDVDTAEAALAHQIGDKVRAAYERGDKFEKRRRLMDAWADYCARAVAADSVVPIRAARS